MYYTIYKITNTINGKYYIGKHQTTDLNDGYMGSGKLIQRALKKYGSENFTKEVLYVFDHENEMNAKEAEIVVVSEQTYNLCPGGRGGFGYINANKLNNKNHEHVASILSIKNKGIKRPYQSERLKKAHQEGKIKSPGITKGMLGKNHSFESRIKMSISGLGMKNSQFGTRWITNGTCSKKIKCNEKIPDGWYKGRVKNNIIKFGHVAQLDGATDFYSEG